MFKNYPIDQEPKLSNTMIMPPHIDENFFPWQDIQEFVEIKSLISFNLACVIYMPKNVFTFFVCLFYGDKEPEQWDMQGTCKRRPLNNSYLVCCDTDCYARI